MSGIQNPKAKGNIVVVGGSYVGMKAVEMLANAMHESHNIVLIEKNSHFHHLFAFPRFAVVGGYEHLAFVPYTNAFHACPPGSASLVRGFVTSVAPGKVQYTDVTSDSNAEINYDYLVVATGTFMPPIAGKQEGIAKMKELQEAVRKANRVAIIGGGAVGVQTATDIKEVYPSKSVTLIHSRDRLINTFHPKMHEIIMDRCNELGIDVILSDRVNLPEDGFPTDGREFDVELTSGRKVTVDSAVKSTGQPPQANFLPPSLLSPTTKRVLVKPTLQLADPQYANAFSVGDVAETGAPKQARPAFKQVQVVVDNIKKLEAGEGDLETYSSDPAAIHLTLGIKRNVIFRNPETPDGEPTYNLKDDGSENLGSERVWTMRAPGVSDFWA